MNLPGKDVCRAMLESFCSRSRIAMVLVDPAGRVEWSNRFAVEEFPGLFPDGATFAEALRRCGPLAPEKIDSDVLSRGASIGDLLRAAGTDRDAPAYRHFELPLEEAGPSRTLHCLVNISHEKRLEQNFLHNLHQLKSMKEIVDILYEQLSTQEVIYLILVAVTSQMGFGFNRAFFLNVKANRLRGRIGIGPSNSEEANQIWTRLAALNFSSLREVYNDLTRNEDVPDLRTQEIALRMDFDLSPLCGEKTLPGLLGALDRGKPARLHSSEAGTVVDRMLFQLLSTDAVAVVPLFVSGSLVGVIIADNFITRRPIAEGDLNLLKIFAFYAGVALERSHLYDELQDTIKKVKDANESLKTNQQRLLQAEKLSAIGEMAAYVSHEIRNPLVAIGGLARSLLKDTIESSDTAETLQIIVSEVSRLEKFLRDTLDFVKPRVAKAASVDLNEVVRDSLATFRNELVRNSIEAQVELSRVPLRCMIDPDLLRHALSNLIKNAIEALEGRGRVLLAVRREGGTAVVRVGDTGRGIPADVVPRIFDPFFTTKSEGTGLGLTLASQNLKSLGGNLELESDPTFRTIFKLTLPLEDTGHRSSSREGLEVSLSGGGHENGPHCR